MYPSYDIFTAMLRRALIRHQLARGLHCVYVALVILVAGECSVLWASGSDPADASADVSMHTAHAGELATVYRDKRLK